MNRNTTDRLKQLMYEVIRFRDRRDWEQFHSPRNLAAALAVESGELQELLLWKTDDEARRFVQSKGGKTKASEEIADVLIFALLFCQSVGVDPEKAIRKKLRLNSKKYPVSLSKGNATKYSDFK